MSALLDLSAWLTGMILLMSCSAFFSSSEAALFSLRASELRILRDQSRAGALAVDLLSRPNRLLTAVLFWNLVINVTYFSLVSIIVRQSHAGATSPWIVFFPIGSLFAMIFFSEMLPKSLGVLAARPLATWVAYPVAFAVRALDPLMPILEVVNLLSQRLLWPGFRPEPYLDVDDLERAIRKSRRDAELQEQEQQVLRQIVAMSDVRVDEWMRPRSQLSPAHPPIRREELANHELYGGYLLITDPETDEITHWLNVQNYPGPLPEMQVEHVSQAVIYVPWCTAVADAYELMVTQEREVAAVVTEHGEIIGILTQDDIIESLFTQRQGRSERLFHAAPIVALDEHTWQVKGMTNLRRVAKELGIEIPVSRSVTVLGWLHERLERDPIIGDTIDWGPFQVTVQSAPSDGPLVVHLTRNQQPRSAGGTR